MTEIFVYGTLQRGGDNHRHLAGAVWVGAARTVPAYRLYQLDGYPGLVEDAAGGGVSVAGEIWAVDDAGLARLDELEGVEEGLYRRAPVRLAPPDAGREVQTYFYARSVAGRRDLGGKFSP